MEPLCEKKTVWNYFSSGLGLSAEAASEDTTESSALWRCISRSSGLDDPHLSRTLTGSRYWICMCWGIDAWTRFQRPKFYLTNWMRGMGNFPLETFREVICLATGCRQQADLFKRVLQRRMAAGKVKKGEKKKPVSICIREQNVKELGREGSGGQPIG